MPLTALVPLLLNLRKGTLRDELDQFYETLGEDAGVGPVTASAFCQARSKLKPEVLEQLNDSLIEQAARQIGLRRWRGFRVLAVDGSTARLPNTPAIEAHFGRPVGSGVPLARLSRLYDVLNGWVIRADRRAVPYR